MSTRSRLLKRKLSDVDESIEVPKDHQVKNKSWRASKNSKNSTSATSTASERGVTKKLKKKSKCVEYKYSDFINYISEDEISDDEIKTPMTLKSDKRGVNGSSTSWKLNSSEFSTSSRLFDSASHSKSQSLTESTGIGTEPSSTKRTIRNSNLTLKDLGCCSSKQLRKWKHQEQHSVPKKVKAREENVIQKVKPSISEDIDFKSRGKRTSANSVLLVNNQEYVDEINYITESESSDAENDQPKKSTRAFNQQSSISSSSTNIIKTGAYGKTTTTTKERPPENEFLEDEIVYISESESSENDDGSLIKEKCLIQSITSDLNLPDSFLKDSERSTVKLTSPQKVSMLNENFTDEINFISDTDNSESELDEAENLTRNHKLKSSDIVDSISGNAQINLSDRNKSTSSQQFVWSYRSEKSKSFEMKQQGNGTEADLNNSQEEAMDNDNNETDIEKCFARIVGNQRLPSFFKGSKSETILEHCLTGIMGLSLDD